MKERFAFRRQLHKAVREATKGTPWHAREGVLFRASEGWFISVAPWVEVNRVGTDAHVMVKPMASDDLFWKIIGLAQLAEEPLSFRAAGGITCKPPIFHKQGIEGDPDTALVAHGLMAVGEAQLDRAMVMTPDDFVTFCQAHATPGQSYFTAILPTLVAAGKVDEALARCRDAREAGVRGNFSKGGRSIVDMTVAWIESEAGPR